MTDAICVDYICDAAIEENCSLDYSRIQAEIRKTDDNEAVQPFEKWIKKSTRK